MWPAITLSLIFGAVASAVLCIYSLVTEVRGGTQARIRRRLDESARQEIRDRVKRSALFKDLGRAAAAAAEGGPHKPSLRERFDRMVEGSGLGITPSAVINIAVVSGIAMAVVGSLVLPSIFVAPVGFCAGVGVPVYFVKRKRAARQEKLLSQLPDAFELMARLVRVGQTMAQAFRSVSDEFPPPISNEFAVCSEQQNLGIAPETALRDLAQRTGLLELKILVVGIVVQEQTGGSLADMLERLGGVIRERYRMRGVVKTLTAEGRMQAILLLALPPALFAIMLLINRSYALELIEHPILILTTLVSEAIGGIWIRAIVNFEV